MVVEVAVMVTETVVVVTSAVVVGIWPLVVLATEVDGVDDDVVLHAVSAMHTAVAKMAIRFMG